MVKGKQRVVRLQENPMEEEDTSHEKENIAREEFCSAQRLVLIEKTEGDNK